MRPFLLPWRGGNQLMAYATRRVSADGTWQVAEGAIRVGWVSVAGLSRAAARQHIRQALARHTAGLVGRGNW